MVPNATEISIQYSEIQNGAGWPSIISPFLFAALYNLKEKLTDYIGIVGLLMAICMGIFFGAISGFFEFYCFRLAFFLCGSYSDRNCP
jgi:hypothetical protein